MNNKVRFSELTWKEVEELPKNTVIFLPIGSMEQNGPHSPLQTDTILVEAFAERVAQETESKVLDTIAYSYSETFKNFPGTIFLKPETLKSLVEDICNCLIWHGFKKIVLVNQHMPNQGIIEHALRRIRDRFDVVIPVIFTASILSILNDNLIDKSLNGHGGEPLNSILLFLKPEVMRMDLAEKGSPEKYYSFITKGSTTVMFENCPVNVYLNMDEVSKSGVYGDPMHSDPKKGQDLFERLVKWGIRFTEEFRKF